MLHKITPNINNIRGVYREYTFDPFAADHTTNGEGFIDAATFTAKGPYKDAEVSVEAHLYSKGGHGFNMGNRSELVTLNTWPSRLADWLRDQFILDPNLENKIKE